MVSKLMMVDGNNKRRHMRKAEAGQGYACLLGVERLGARGLLLQRKLARSESLRDSLRRGPSWRWSMNVRRRHLPMVTIKMRRIARLQLHGDRDSRPDASCFGY